MVYSASNGPHSWRLLCPFAYLTQATNADELPEYVLGTVRIDRMKLESAIEI